MPAAQSRLIVALFEAAVPLPAIAWHFGRPAPEVALALARALQARADRYAIGGMT